MPKGNSHMFFGPLRLNVKFHAEQRETYWVVTTDPFAITVYARTRDAVEKRAFEAIDFLVHNIAPKLDDTGIAKLREYLDKHAVKYSITGELHHA